MYKASDLKKLYGVHINQWEGCMWLFYSYFHSLNPIYFPLALPGQLSSVL